MSNTTPLFGEAMPEDAARRIRRARRLLDSAAYEADDLWESIPLSELPRIRANLQAIARALPRLAAKIGMK